jgi:cobalt-zinc-cadmium efflux system membrane fusion protein
VSDQRSDLLTAQKRLSFAETTYSREKRLWEEKISAEQDYLQARQAVEESRLAVANARQKLAAIGASSAGAALNQFAIRAPFNGTVVEKHIVLGDAVKEDAAVFTISDLQTVWADVAISPASLGAVRVGTKVVVQATAFMGEQSRTAHARVTLTNPAALWRPGMFATVAVANGEVTAPVTVQADAVQTVDNVPTVFVETSGGFLAREVKLGRGSGQTIEILQGLRAGDRYVATGSFVLKADLGKSSVQSDD